ncbi:heparinase II/III family protein [Daejeonella sp. JGW-45]|uniref:heparinase II/III domain-containing protein n=1 Tax=Daejeonella sp. JGW-45 TaxID=3034148 RepID=UPI0023ECF430|nr:heparinase II/III family protein [Daejeonella sp. JGW-45]
MISKIAGFIFVTLTSVAGAFGQVSMADKGDNKKVTELRSSVAALLGMSLEQIKELVPAASGLNFIGCPNCRGGAQDMGVLNWEPALGSDLKCKYCSMLFPNEKFPYTGEQVIIAPSGAKQVYRYYENKEGVKYYFEAHVWFEQWKWIQGMASKLSQLWELTKNTEYGDRAAVIIGRFAQVFPDYAVRYDYPSAPVRFFPADQKWPYEGLPAYRGAKWNWWGYGDIPAEMAKVYANLRDGYQWERMDKLTGVQTDRRIETDLLLKGYEFTSANPEIYTNMSPGMYRDMVTVGRILKKPEIVHDGVKRFREFLKLGFFADGWWKEGTGSYHDQTIGSLRAVALAAQNYTDPGNWTGERLENLDLVSNMPFFKMALRVSEEAILPDGRKIPINDTWAYRNGTPRPTEKTVSRLWGALGNAALGVGEGSNQTMLNVNWSGNYGHSHYDNGSIILYAKGAELFSDIGYTHSKYRGWTIHTASHNTVVIDQKAQDAGNSEKPVTGNLKFYDDSHPHVKAIDVDASPAYSKAEQYRRRLVLVHAAPGRDYIVDRFDVKGGETHDWFLHGMAEEEGKLSVSIPLKTEVPSIVPEWGGNDKPRNQYESDLEGKKIHAYSYLRNIRSAPVTDNWTATWRYENSGVRTHSMAQPGAQLFTFKSPSVRRAQENDNKLNSFMSNGLMQRHTGGTSSFIAIHEPFQQEPWIKSAEQDGNWYIVKYELNGKQVEDRISINEKGITVTSGAGWNYNSGSQVSGDVLSFSNTGAPKLQIDREVKPVKFVRIDISGGRTMVYQVKNVSGKLLELDEDPGFTLDGTGALKLLTFPHTEFRGPVRYTVFEPGK